MKAHRAVFPLAAMCRVLGVEGVTRRHFRTGTTKRDPKARPAPDLVDRDFSADGPDRLWVADIAQVRAGAGWLYLAVVLDCWSRRIVGWAMAPGMPAELVGDAYDNAMCESFFATPECEILDRRSFATRQEARREVFSFVEGFYNTRRLHSALGYRSPVDFEKLGHAA